MDTKQVNRQQRDPNAIEDEDNDQYNRKREDMVRPDNNDEVDGDQYGNDNMI